MSIGIMQLLLILVIILLLFGAGKLPTVMSQLGKGLKSFKDAVRSDESDINKN